MPGDQQRAGGDDDDGVLQEGGDNGIAHRQAPHGPDHGGKQHRVDDKVGKARGAADNNLIEHHAAHLFAGEQVWLADNARTPVATLFFSPVRGGEG